MDIYVPRKMSETFHRKMYFSPSLTTWTARQKLIRKISPNLMVGFTDEFLCRAYRCRNVSLADELSETSVEISSSHCDAIQRLRFCQTSFPRIVCSAVWDEAKLKMTCLFCRLIRRILIYMRRCVQTITSKIYTQHPPTISWLRFIQHTNSLGNQ